jgi:hypothetical protein
MDHIWGWTHKVRTMSIQTRVRGFLAGAENKGQTHTLFQEAVFPSPECKECNRIGDFWHLWTRRRLRELREKEMEEVEKIRKKYSDPEKYWIDGAEEGLQRDLARERVKVGRVHMRATGTWHICTMH